MSTSPAQPHDSRAWRLSAAGAVVAFLLSMTVSLVWRANAWPGAVYLAPAVFFGTMGATFAWTGPRWRNKAMHVKLLIVILYGLLGALVVGGLTTLVQ